MKKLIILSVCGLLFACKGKDGADGLGALTGTGVGTVYIHNEYGIQLPYHKGVNVRVDGSNLPLSAVTDSSGHFTIKELETGTYDFILSKPGYGNTKIQGITFLGGARTAQLGVGDIYQTSTVVPSSFTLDTIGGVVNVNGSANFDQDTANAPMYVMVFIGKDVKVSASNYLFAVKANITGAAGNTSGNFQCTIPSSSFKQYGLKGKSTAYMAVYGGDDFSYTDLNTNKKVYVGLNPSFKANQIVLPNF